MTDPGAAPDPRHDELPRLRRQLDRERRARAESETIAETVMRTLYVQERQVKLLQVIAAASNQTSVIEDAIQIALDEVCAYTGWPVGHAYLVEPSSGELAPTDLWHLDDPARFAAFRATTMAKRLSADAGLPGRVLQSGEPAWIADVTADPNFPRAAGGTDPGVRAGFACPVLVGKEVVAILEFFSAVPAERDDALLRAMANIGTQLGRVIERRRAEEASQAVYLQTEKLAAMGSMLAGVAHELNNPLAVVMGEALLLQRALAEGPLAGRAGKIVAAAERCAKTVQSFLALARQQPAAREALPLNRVAREAVELLSYQLRVADITVAWRLAGDLPLVSADPHQIHQVLVNLVSNAHHALRAAAAPRTLTIASRHDEARQRVVLEVADTGPGVPPEIRARIFDPFFTTKAPGQGTGLGLSLCRGIVEDHGGSITVGAGPDGGAVFTVELPVVASPVVAAAPASPGPAAAPEIIRGKRILVVDDEPDVAQTLGDMLQIDEHRVEFAENGAVALDKLRTGAYDLVLSDLRMPQLDGPGLYHEVERIRPELCGRFVFVSGDALSGDIQAFFRRTRARSISKPFAVRDVRRVVQAALRA